MPMKALPKFKENKPRRCIKCMVDAGSVDRLTCSYCCEIDLSSDVSVPFRVPSSGAPVDTENDVPRRSNVILPVCRFPTDEGVVAKSQCLDQLLEGADDSCVVDAKSNLQKSSGAARSMPHSRSWPITLLGGTTAHVAMMSKIADLRRRTVVMLSRNCESNKGSFSAHAEGIGEPGNLFPPTRPGNESFSRLFSTQERTVSRTVRLRASRVGRQARN